MKIISKTGKRIDGKESDKQIKKQLKETDPILRNAEKGEIEELSPMDPPHAFDDKRAIGADYENLHDNLKVLSDEHKDTIVKCDAFEKALVDFKEGGYYITREINTAFNEFFVDFDENILPHFKKEEQGLFPILRKRLLENWRLQRSSVFKYRIPRRYPILRTPIKQFNNHK